VSLLRQRARVAEDFAAEPDYAVCPVDREAYTAQLEDFLTFYTSDTKTQTQTQSQSQGNACPEGVDAPSSATPSLNPTQTQTQVPTVSQGEGADPGVSGSPTPASAADPFSLPPVPVHVRDRVVPVPHRGVSQMYLRRESLYLRQERHSHNRHMQCMGTRQGTSATPSGLPPFPAALPAPILAPSQDVSSLMASYAGDGGGGSSVLDGHVSEPPVSSMIPMLPAVHRALYSLRAGGGADPWGYTEAASAQETGGQGDGDVVDDGLQLSESDVYLTPNVKRETSGGRRRTRQTERREGLRRLREYSLYMASEESQTLARRLSQASQELEGTGASHSQGGGVGIDPDGDTEKGDVEWQPKHR
ncbi:hypothetical protein KIPB_011853, partial [Kipferlia bialata]